ncbi:response regulator transcription factor [Priestia megaterium]|nr:response regulator transcription factor [Priestia megaterium]
MNKPTILIIDDEKDMRKLIKLSLEREGYMCLEASNGPEALEELTQMLPSLLIIDVMMPMMDGFTLAQRIRSVHPSIPIIFLTARGDEWDRIHGLKIGGDDYIVKPFSIGELIARVEAVLRRTTHIPVQVQAFDYYGSVKIDKFGRNVFVNEEPVSLTLKEYELLIYLCNRLGHVFTREQLLQHVWGFDYFGSERTVDTHIKTLRLKLKSAGSLIQTVWGIGYKAEVLE